MGNLTDDMTRLRGEVDALRSERGALMQELTRGARNLASTVSAMQANFAAAHAAMAKKTSEEREAFVADMIREVSSLLEDFSRIRGDMTRTGRNDREAFLLEMRRQVTGMRKETADDLAGARLAWRGQSPRKSRPAQLKKEPEIVALPTPPPVEEAAVEGAATEKKQVALPAVQLQATPEIREKEKVYTPKAKVVESPKAKTTVPVFAKMEVPKQKEKPWLDEKPAKAATKAKRGRK
ncbi:MAG: hypothetical protein Q7J31_03030 [Syntrophales bacterium]|nr:hypothetical protein [Syntrophales bacterium]